MTTYGCNALYRDFIPDYLISMDILMVMEIIENKIHYDTKFYTQHGTKTDDLYRIGEPIHFIESQRETPDSGNAALRLCASNNHDIVYMIGFDYTINDTIPNIYTGTKNYNKSTVYPGATHQDTRWKNKLRQTLQKYPNTKFVRVLGNANKIDIMLDNFIEITTNEFTEELYGIYN